MEAPLNQMVQDANDARAQTLLPIMIMFGIMAVLGVCGNAVVFIVYRTRFIQTSSAYFITWLAILDAVTCAVGIPFDIIDLRYSYVFDNRPACKTMRFIICFNVLTSAVLLIVIAFDRYYKICKPLKRLPVRSTKILIAVSFLIGIIFSWPALALWGRNDIEIAGTNATGYTCSIEKGLRETRFPVVYFGILAGIFFMSVVFLIVLYARLVFSLWQRKKAMISVLRPQLSTSSLQIRRISKDDPSGSPKQSPTVNQQLRQRNSRANYKGFHVERTTAIFLAISFVFMLSFIPFLVLMTLREIMPDFETFDSTSKEIAFNFFLRSYFLNNVINPFIYGFLNPSFRRECWLLVLKFKNKCFHPATKDAKNHDIKLSSLKQRPSSDTLDGVGKQSSDSHA